MSKVILAEGSAPDTPVAGKRVIYAEADGIYEKDDAGVTTNLTTAAPAASESVSGIAELATQAEVNTGTDTSRIITPDKLAGADHYVKYVAIVCFDFTTDLAVGNGAGYLHIPAGLAGMNLVEVHAEVITAGTTGTADIQIANVTQAADMLSTKLTIDTTPDTGSDQAATPPVIDTANDDVAENDLLRIDVDVIHTTPAKGLLVTLGFALP